MNIDSSVLKKAQKAIGYEFKDKGLLREALTHKSAHKGAKTPNYERLEFLGDRVLGLVVAEKLLDTFKKEDEGEISRRFSALVNQQTLVEVAKDLKLHEVVQTANFDSQKDIENTGILSDVMESIIAAIYLDSGLRAARKFVESQWHSLIRKRSDPPKDAKTALQEWAQSQGLALPVYRVTGKQGLDHNPVFEVSVNVSGIPPTKALGASKRAAEQEAAQKALEIINRAS